MGTGLQVDVRGWRESLLADDAGRLGEGVAADTARADLIAELERLKAAACAVQADLAVALDRSVRGREADAGVPVARRGRGVAAQVALARRTSPHRGQALLGLARDLDSDLPHTRAALRTGRLDEHTVLLLARELGCLGRAERAEVDARMCADPATLEGMGTARVVAAARREVCAADPAAVVRRARRAAADRHVRLRPAPDAMTYLTALLPVAQGVAAWAALARDADSARATGAGDRSRGQVMADLAVERLTGRPRSEAVPVSVDLIVSDATLLGAGSEPAVVPGHGPVPAQLAREIVADALTAQDDAASTAPPVWLRRLYADPSGQLVAATSRRRFVADGLAALLRVRDQGLCRTPFCDAPARHGDHVIPAARGGPTTADNSQSLCEACNYARQADGWSSTTVPGARHTVVTTTPTGHRWSSRAPAPPEPAGSPASPAATGRVAA